MSKRGCPNQGCPNQGCPNQGCPNQGCPNQGCPNQGCPNQGCSKNFKQDGLNDINLKRQIDKCSHRIKVVKEKGNIRGFFKRQEKPMNNDIIISESVSSCSSA